MAAAGVVGAKGDGTAGGTVEAMENEEAAWLRFC